MRSPESGCHLSSILAPGSEAGGLSGEQRPERGRPRWPRHMGEEGQRRAMPGTQGPAKRVRVTTLNGQEN